MSKMLTVSVAAYNMEKYIRQCLDSLAVSEIIDDLEVFVIDDGGTDGTLDIAKEYAAKYPASFFPIHKDNGGWGSTVNYSITHATGKYFKILDGDDWFDKDGAVRLVQALKKFDADVTVTNFYRAWPDYTKLEEIAHESETKVKNISDVIDQIPVLNLSVLTYRTEILRESRLKIPEHMFYCDLYYQTIPFSQANTILFLNFPVVWYRLGRKGQSVSVSSKINHQDELVRICKDLIDYTAKIVRRKGNNYLYIMKRMASTYRVTLAVLRLNPVSRESLDKIKSLEDFLHNSSEELYEYLGSNCGKFLWLMRKTNYRSYWLLRLMKQANYRDKIAWGGVTRTPSNVPVIACCAGCAA